MKERLTYDTKVIDKLVLDLNDAINMFVSNENINIASLVLPSSKETSELLSDGDDLEIRHEKIRNLYLKDIENEKKLDKEKENILNMMLVLKRLLTISWVLNYDVNRFKDIKDDYISLIDKYNFVLTRPQEFVELLASYDFDNVMLSDEDIKILSNMEAFIDDVNDISDVLDFKDVDEFSEALDDLIVCYNMISNDLVKMLEIFSDLEEEDNDEKKIHCCSRCKDCDSILCDNAYGLDDLDDLGGFEILDDLDD